MAYNTIFQQHFGLSMRNHHGAMQQQLFRSFAPSSSSMITDNTYIHVTPLVTTWYDGTATLSLAIYCYLLPFLSQRCGNYRSSLMNTGRQLTPHDMHNQLRCSHIEWPHMLMPSKSLFLSLCMQIIA